LDNARIITEAEITKTMIYDGDSLEINQCTKEGKLSGMIYITIRALDEKNRPINQCEKYIVIPAEFAQFIVNTLENHDV
jgi:hypothetical protein